MREDIKDMLLKDALREAIEANKKVIKLKRLVKVLSVVILAGVVVWIIGS